MKSIGALQQLGYKFARISKWEDTATLDRYVASDEFFRLFAAVPAVMRVSAMKCYMTANEKCAKRHPVAAPRQAKADWKKPGEIERFKRAWLKHGGNKYRVAREMGITEGAVGIAYSRFIRHGVTTTYIPGTGKKPPRLAQQRQRASQPPSVARPKSESARPNLAAA